MRSNDWFTRPASLSSRVRVAIAGGLLLSGAAIALVLVRSAAPKPPQHAIAMKKGDPDAKEAMAHKRALFGNSEVRGLYTPAIEDFLKRAFPASDVSAESTVGAWNGWASLDGKSHSGGTWELVGPSIANVPGVLNALGDAAPYITAGRVTALALAPNCTEGHCRLYVAAAGGGVWRTDKALHTNPSEKWEFISGSFGTNAIGSLLLDPRDPTGNTLYAATGEENASADSEAGVGIFKTTNGGQQLVAGARQRRLLPALDRSDGVRLVGKSSRADRQRCPRHQLGQRRIAVECRRRSSARAFAACGGNRARRSP